MIRKPTMTEKQKQVAYRAAGRMYAAMAGVAPKAMDLEPIPRILKPKKTAVQLPKESEADILHSIMAMLKHHPKVAKVWRQNSGVFQMQYGAKTHYVRANTARGMSDIAGILKGGRGLYIEVKAAKGRVMEHQQEFLDSMTEAGAVAFIARSVDEVLTKLEDL